jgi:hypothetical protein
VGMSSIFGAAGCDRTGETTGFRQRPGALDGGGDGHRRDSDGDRDLSPGVSGFDVPHGLGHPVQGIRPVDARGHGAGGDVVGENFQVAVPFLGREAGQSLADEGCQEQSPQLPVDASGEVAFAFAADDDGGPGGGQRAPEGGER